MIVMTHRTEQVRRMPAQGFREKLLSAVPDEVRGKLSVLASANDARERAMELRRRDALMVIYSAKSGANVPVGLFKRYDGFWVRFLNGNFETHFEASYLRAIQTQKDRHRSGLGGWKTVSTTLGPLTAYQKAWVRAMDCFSSDVLGGALFNPDVRYLLERHPGSFFPPNHSNAPEPAGSGAAQKS